MKNNTTSSPGGPGVGAVRAENPNGVAGQQANGTSTGEARRQAMQRAEELADRWGQQIGQYATLIGRGVLKWAARAREEAEDIWAEAQALRQRQHSANDGSQSAPGGGTGPGGSQPDRGMRSE
jgi:hypothetical protein